MTKPLDIAIVGMDGMFAKAPDKEIFWSNILNKVNAITEASDEWLGEERLLDPDAPLEKLRIYTRRGGFLHDISRFDPRPYGTMPISVLGGEADQFLALHGTALALRDGGYGEDRDFDRSRVGVIFGHAIHANRGNVNGFQHAIMVDQVLHTLDHLLPDMSDATRDEAEKILRKRLPKFSVDTLPALVPNMMTGRICNRLDLQGPNYILDGACASTSLALLAAADELRSGRADMMLAGGVNTTTSSLVYGVFCQLGALSRNEQVRPFSAHADGTLLGEGQGVFLLKRLEDALQNEDQIHAVIKGVGISSDGRSSGLMAPFQRGEEQAIARAYENTGIDPNSIDLLEAHGTGIPLGDRTEVNAMRAVFGERTGGVPHIALGSVKSMVGHTIPAAGAASLIKVTMALKEGILPPTLVEERNPDLGLETTPFYLNREPRPWLRRKDQPRRAGINSFGFGGINSHISVEESPYASMSDLPVFGTRRVWGPELFTWAANSKEDLLGTLRTAQNALAEGESSQQAFTTFADQTVDKAASDGGNHRLAFVAKDFDSLKKKLETAEKRLADKDEADFGIVKSGIFYASDAKQGKVAFMYPGEHSQYAGMLSDILFTSPTTHRWMERLEDLFGDSRAIAHRQLLFGPRDEYTEEERKLADETLARVEEGSEAVFFTDMAYFRLLSSLGVKPDAMIGHSTGENAALISSNVIGLNEEGVSNFIRSMNTIFQSIEERGEIPSGTLLNVGAVAPEAIQDVLGRFPDVRFTMDNCPNQAIIFGPKDVMETVGKELAGKGGVVTPLPLSWAYHTEFIKPLADEFHALFQGAPIGEPIATLYSCSTAEPYPDAPADIFDTAAQQYMTRVRFTDVIQRMYNDGVRSFIEVGAGSSLQGFVKDILKADDVLVASCDNRKRSPLESLLTLLGQLFTVQLLPDAAVLKPTVRTDYENVSDDPRLPSELPLIHLDEDSAEKLRQTLKVTSSGAPAASAGQAAPSAPSSQPSPAAPAGVAPAAQPGGARQTVEPVFHRIDQMLAVPQSVRLWRAQVADRPSEDDLQRWATRLDEGTRNEWVQRFAKSHPMRRQEWLLARILAKHAVADYLGLPSGDPVVIGQHASGQPMAVVTHAGAVPTAAPPLSIAHKDGMAVIGVGASAIGADIERVGIVRDSVGMAERILTDDERYYLDQARSRSAALVTFWALKEATAKLLAAPFVGQERAFVVDAIREDTGEAMVGFAGTMVRASFRVVGEYVYAVAYYEAAAAQAAE
ncbi:putative glycolipid synthase [Parvularcula bermudensis HTCC2503]|uniref:Putative glycolipid synthase n=1 Tax=Parvularcula bermudensis (strain ATCC BAA-594 / HTCC2503 / KCTC 12087) TaxID=314260 RepID=E0TFF2_PARBH|nr:type I polyketide synthase [Parvularcula bermudensis]ADM09553.1 putative glycolipid synthase [Parvularcula bermudensis HTCC2503]